MVRNFVFAVDRNIHRDLAIFAAAAAAAALLYPIDDGVLSLYQ
jgi:hypothetical protein